MNLKKQRKKLNMIMKQNDKMIKKGARALEKWQHPYTVEQYQNAIAWSYNPKTNDLDIFS